MGTAVQHAVDPVAILPLAYNVFGVNNSDSWDFVKIKKALTDNSMDRRIEKFTQESVRMTMLKHEEIFKEQVLELHRIYKVQKLLMAEFRNNEPQLHSPTILSSQTGRIGGKCIVTDNQTGFWTTATISETNHSPFSSWNHILPNQTNSGYNFNTLISMRADPHLQEQSSSCSRDTSKLPRGFDLERLAEADISNDISAIEDKAEPNSLKSSKDKMNITSSCDPCFYNDGENEVELTLSIGFGTNKKNSKNCKAHSSPESGCSKPNNYERRELDRSLSIRSDAGDQYSERTNSTGSAGAAFDREGLQQPPWLFQALSLNRT